MLKRLASKIAAFFKGLWGYAMRHKIQAVIALLIIAGIAYWGYSAYAKSVTTTQYVLAAARTEPIEATVTGSGQIASEHQLNLSPKTGGTLTSVVVKAGDQVTAGQLIATVDSTDAQKSLRDAGINLETARISYEQAKSSNSNSLQKSRDAVFSTGATVYSDINTTLSGINTIMQGNEVSGSYATKNVYAYSKLFDDNPSLLIYRDRLLADYTKAQNSYQAAFSDYTGADRSADGATVAALASETLTATQDAAAAAKDLNDYLNAVKSRYSPNDSSQPAILSTHISSSLSYLNTLNTDVSSALSAKNDITSAVAALGGSGTATLSEESAQLTYQKAQNSYQDAKDKLADYVVRAPFDGTIASVALQKYDTAGSSATVAVLITKEQLATLSLNEVDAAKVKSGQKATLTFDAIDGLTIDGTVAEVDGIGTVSQGVVSYTVKIGFTSEDPRILPGMTVNATIVTASKEDALVIPSSAIKTQGTQSYVEVVNYAPTGMASTTRSFQGRMREGSTTSTSARQFTGTTSGTAAFKTAGPTVDASSVTTRRVVITTGIESDTMTEVTSGLTAGEFVVSQSLNASGKSTTQSKSLFSFFGPQQRAGGTGTRTTTGTNNRATGATPGATRSGGGNAVFIEKGP